MARLSTKASVLVVALVIFNSIFASNIPSPLYVIYQQKFHFSSLTLTAVYAIYALGIIAALMLVGQLSDQIGRRPVLLVAVGLIFVGGCVFIFSSTPVTLFAARFVQGLATGTMASAASAAMADLVPAARRQRASLITTLAYTAGSALGALSSGVMAEYLPDPLVLPFVVLLGVTVCSGAGVLVMPEPSREALVEEWHLQRPGVPASIRAPFLAASLVLVVSWAIGGVYGALCPSMTRELLHIDSHAFAGAMICLFNLLGAAAQLSMRNRGPRRNMGLGAVVSAVGVGLVVVAVEVHSAPAFLFATVCSGGGSSLAFVGSLSQVNNLSPPTQRAEVLAAFNLLGYLGLSLPVLGMGIVSSAAGLSVATSVFGALIAALALTVLAMLGTRRFGGRASPQGEVVLGGART